MFAIVWFVQYLQAYASYPNVVKEKTAIYCMIQYIAVEKRYSGGPLHVTNTNGI